VALDLAWTAQSADEAARLVDGLELAWVEDPFISGATRELIRLREILDVPLASGDEESHLYHPEALLDAGAVDIIRIDATCQGGVTRMVRLGERLRDYGVPVSWHMNTFVHRQLAGIAGIETKSIEISSPGSGVDVLAEMLASESRNVLRGVPWTDAKGWGVVEPRDQMVGSDDGWEAFEM
jgi:L-alanine-DL-glutamate epimerase-like enolase superfamily enzyme